MEPVKKVLQGDEGSAAHVIGGEFAGIMERLQNKEIDPYKAVRMVLELVLPKRYGKTAGSSRRA